MRISITGAQNTGKTTLVKNFIAVWPQYSTPTKTYRDVIREKNLPHSSTTTTESQWSILNFMLDQMQQYDKNSNVVYDRCPLDNLVYTLWAFDKGLEGFNKSFVDKCITITKESLRQLDIIFLTRFDASLPVENDGLRDANIDNIIEVDNLFSALFKQFQRNYDADVFFPKNDSPGIIELPVNPQQRIDLIAEYVDPQGNSYGEEASIFNPNHLDQLEALVKQQRDALEQEQKERELYKKFGLIV